MPDVANRSRGELRRILLLGLLVIAIVLAAGLGGIAFAALAVDRAVAGEERGLVIRTLDRRQAKLVEDITSATVWDDAYVKTVQAFDAEWADENYGVYYATYMHHDRTLLFDPGDTVIYASEAGEVAPPRSLGTFAGDITPLLTALRRDEVLNRSSRAPTHGLKGATTRAAIVRSGGELWLVALSTVIPETTKVVQAGGPSAVIASGRRLDAAFLGELQNDLGIEDAHLLKSGEAPRGPVAPLYDQRGGQLGRLTWTPCQPGAGILKDALAPILLIIAAFAVATVALSQRVLRALRALAANDARLETVLEDLTEARDRAEAASVAKSQFLANISHEIRTPLNGVLGMAQIMDRGELVPAQRQHLAIIRESGVTLLALLNDVLDLAKIEAGKLEIHREDVDLRGVVASASGAFSGMAADKLLRLTYAIEPDAADVWRLDAMRLGQVLANLVSNAVKFTARGEVSLRAWTSPRGLEFAVSDTGEGIAPDRLADLFGKFNQLDASTTRQFGGSGLGLAICRELVELMGGEMAVESTVGRGSTFSFHLPAERGRGRVAA
ncbi:MAG: ATP-binding protein [Caulobacter sp.]|nr:ATP-binding protein [Caulobacter sp.]